MTASTSVNASTSQSAGNSLAPRLIQKFTAPPNSPPRRTAGMKRTKALIMKKASTVLPRRPQMKTPRSVPSARSSTPETPSRWTATIPRIA